MPPPTVNVTLPVLLPLQSTDLTLDVNVNFVGCVTISVIPIVQLFVSITVNEYVPAARPLNVVLLWYDPVPTLYLYGDVPPDPVNVTLPELIPLHAKFVTLELNVKSVGSVTLTDNDCKHPFESLTVNV